MKISFKVKNETSPNMDWNDGLIKRAAKRFEWVYMRNIFKIIKFLSKDGSLVVIVCVYLFLYLNITCSYMRCVECIGCILCTFTDDKEKDVNERSRQQSFLKDLFCLLIR